MNPFSLEHSATVYWVDFALYAMFCVGALATLLSLGAVGDAAALLMCVVSGVVLWSLLEYFLHRYVLHGIAPFSHWHSQHHVRPRAVIATPIALSLPLFLSLGAISAWWILGILPAVALSLGLMSSYLIYGLTHHATHHSTSPWIRHNCLVE